MTAGGKSATQGRARIGRRRAHRLGPNRVGDSGDIGGSGDFDASLVVAMIKKRIGAIRACYEKGAEAEPDAGR